LLPRSNEMKFGASFSYTGLFITFEGVEGCGKTTQIRRLATRLENMSIPIFLTREPGGPPLSEKIRSLLLDPKNCEISSLTEALLYQASRAQHVEQWIYPALDAGKIVLCDRFFDASTAYQGIARGLGKELIRSLNNIAAQGLAPDLTFMIDLPVEIGLRRGRSQSIGLFPDGEGDRMEQEPNNFHQQVRSAYRELAAENERCFLIDGMRSIEEIETEIFAQVKSIFDRRNYS